MDTNSEDINLVVLNLNIPKCSSKEMLARIAQKCPHAPILLASGFDSQANADKLSQKGVAGFVHKPFSMLTLAQAIRRALDETAKSAKRSKK